ncbi:MAG: hypothetical protein R3F37_17320 [Candidatus Competibacteraceae bacterium]
MTVETDGAPTKPVIPTGGRGAQKPCKASMAAGCMSIRNMTDKGVSPVKAVPYYAGDPAYWHQLSHDVANRVVEEISPDGSRSTMVHDGLATTVINARNQVNTRIQNVRGELVYVLDADENGTDYRYTPHGDLAATTDAAGNVIANQYDIRGRKIETHDPDMGVWRYAYNAAGGLIRQTDAKNQTVQLGYDALGRQVQRNEAEGLSSWAHDSAAHGIGKLARAVGAEGEITEPRYDALGRVSQQWSH